jgi:hypothetical protein
MALKTYRPLTPASRYKALPGFDEIRRTSLRNRWSNRKSVPAAVTTAAA